MSFNWENIVWQSKDGKFGIGFFDRISRGSWGDDDYDSEWDDEFDYSVFSFASTGHLTANSAHSSWNGANPGSSTEIPYSRANAKEIAEYEEMAKAYKDPVYAQKRLEAKAKAEINKLRAVLLKRMRADLPQARSKFQVQFANSNVNVRTHITATLYEEGDWLGFNDTKKLKSGKTVPNFVRVWNTKTQSLAPKVIAMDKVVMARMYY